MYTFRKGLLLLTVLILGQLAAAPQIIHLKKGDRHLMLFGTVHIAKPDFYPLPQSVLTQLEKADTLAVELDTTDSDIKNQTVQLMLEAAFNPNTQPLNEKQLSQIKAIFGRVDGSLGGEPWFLSIMISLERTDRLGFSEPGIDETIITLAKQQGKRVVSLEKPAEQIDIFTQIPQRESLQLFEDAVSDDFDTQLALTESIWRDNDKKTAEMLHKAMQQETPVLYRLLNNERNQHMAERIIKHSENASQLFVAIGAMHLYGKGSVVEALINHGFERGE